MRPRTCFLSFAIIALAVLAYLTMDNEWKMAYCTNCGLLRNTNSKICFGLPLNRAVTYRETEYHRLRRDLGQGACGHLWKACFDNHHHSYTGAVRIPFVLSPYFGLRDQLALLRRLGDRAKISAVLASFDLSQGDFQDFDHACAVKPAIDELERVPAVLSEEQWWSKHEHLFSDRTVAP